MSLFSLVKAFHRMVIQKYHTNNYKIWDLLKFKRSKNGTLQLDYYQARTYLFMLPFLYAVVHFNFVFTIITIGFSN